MAVVVLEGTEHSLLELKAAPVIACIVARIDIVASIDAKHLMQQSCDVRSLELVVYDWQTSVDNDLATRVIIEIAKSKELHSIAVGIHHPL